jgi:membrane protease YdiL (CAAX protease family)
VAFAFAVEHVVGGMRWLHAILGAGIGSLLLGMAALATRGLAMPISLHAAWNFGQWWIVRFLNRLRRIPGISSTLPRVAPQIQPDVERAPAVNSLSRVSSTASADTG